MFFDRTVADTSRATSEVLKAREVLNIKRNGLDTVGEGREAVSNRLHALGDARWLANLWAFDHRLAGDLLRAQEEVNQAESNLNGRREDLSARKRELALAQARLQIARNLGRYRRRAASRRRERRLEDLSGFRTRCL
jgi:hypothetical protein